MLLTGEDKKMGDKIAHFFYHQSLGDSRLRGNDPND